MGVVGIDTSGAGTIANKTQQTGKNSLDKDAFLQLLVTQMQYQDPLQPTDNTEWMSQMAQFSQMEAMNNLNSAFSNSQALGLVGEYVLLNVKDSSGALKQVGGLVQYVTISNNQALLRVNDEYYTMDEFDSVVDWNYIEWLKEQQENSTGNTDGTTDDKDEDNKVDKDDEANKDDEVDKDDKE